MRMMMAFKSALWGVVSLVLYYQLLAHQKEVIDLGAAGRWNFLVPVAIAFVFSYVHGSFTGTFWSALGIKGKTTRG